jgi:hypothetical protein
LAWFGLVVGPVEAVAAVVVGLVEAVVGVRVQAGARVPRAVVVVGLVGVSGQR